MGDEQDMRKMGGLVRVLPYTYAMFFIGSLALMGFPFNRFLFKRCYIRNSLCLITHYMVTLLIG